MKGRPLTRVHVFVRFTLSYPVAPTRRAMSENAAHTISGGRLITVWKTQSVFSRSDAVAIVV